MRSICSWDIKWPWAISLPGIKRPWSAAGGAEAARLLEDYEQSLLGHIDFEERQTCI